MLIGLIVDQAIGAPTFEVTVEGTGGIVVEAPVGPVSEAVGILELGRRNQLEVLVRPGDHPDHYIVETTLRRRRAETRLSDLYIFCRHRCVSDIPSDPPAHIAFVPDTAP